MVWLKYVGGVLVVIALCAVIWFIHPAKGQVKQLEDEVTILEKQIGRQYSDTINSLRDTIEMFLEWDFNKPLTDINKGTFEELSEEFFDIMLVLFFGNNNKLVHSEWKYRMHDVHGYLFDYLYGGSLSKEEVADLHQALHAIRFISMDFNDIVQYDDQASYDAMHDEEHEMVERVKYRLSTEY